MERLTHKRENGIKRGYWSPNKKQELVDRLAMYEDREDAKDTNVLGKWIPCSEKLPEDESYILAKRLADFESRVPSQILQQHTAVPAEHRKDQKIRLH